MKEEFNNCVLCPNRCMVNRNNGQVGFCLSGNKMKIAKAYLHKWEEPCISGEIGSGTIFFSGCNIRCIFCQNYYISELNNGRFISIGEFANTCLDLQNKGAVNINLVTPTHFVPLIIDGLLLAKKKGLTIPIVYNSSGYEEINTLKMLDGIIDIYLPDFKYYNDDYALKYSGCKNYFKYTSNAIQEMVRQQPNCVFDKKGNMLKGVIVRHLILPSLEEDSKKILKYLFSKYQNNIYYSIMNQYTPVRKCKYSELNYKLNSNVYDSVIDFAWDLGIRNAFTQENGTQSEIYIPNFKNEN